MSKRTLKEIENDYKRIRHIVDTTPVASIVELANASGLTASEVKTSLAKHPRIAKIIMAQLENNKEALKAQNKSKATANHTDSKSKAAPTTGQSEETAGFDVGVVIDASIAGIETLEDVFSQLFKSKAKIILTSITLNELEKMQKFRFEKNN